MAISLAGNLITLTGNGASPAGGTSWGNAYDMEDVLTACGGVVSKQGANAYDISARMRFESGVYFISKSEFVELKPDPVNPAYTFYMVAGSHVRFGEYNASDKFSYNGAFWRMYVNSTTNQGNKIYGELLVYGSSIWTDTTNYQKGLQLMAGATVRYYNSLFKYCGYFWAVNTDLQDVKWFGGGGSYDMLVACGIEHNWAGLTTMDCQKGIFFSATTTGNVDVYDATILNAGTDIFISTGISASWLVRVINSPTFVTCSTPGSGKKGVQRCYTFNVKVTTDEGSPIVGATVELKDVDGDVVFSEQTVSGGVLTSDKIVKEYWFRHANDGGNKSYNDHTLKVVNGADETEYKIKIDHKITEDVVLLPQSVASYDNIMAGITDIKTETDKMNFSGDNIQSRVANKGVLNNPPSETIADYKDKNTEEEIKTAIDNYTNKDTYKEESMKNYNAIYSIIQALVKNLSYENFRINDIEYDADDNIISVLFKIYASKDDCEDNVNPTAQFLVIATYTNNRLETYRMIKQL